jgi:hypothetical protein
MNDLSFSEIIKDYQAFIESEFISPVIALELI